MVVVLRIYEPLLLQNDFSTYVGQTFYTFYLLSFIIFLISTWYVLHLSFAIVPIAVITVHGVLFTNLSFVCLFQRIAETLDVEIKRWAAGKEGNLRALLSTLQYVCHSYYILFTLSLGL